MAQFFARASLTYRIAGEPKRELRQVEPLPLGLRQQERAPQQEGDLPESRGQARSLPEQLASGERRPWAAVVFQA